MSKTRSRKPKADRDEIEALRTTLRQKARDADQTADRFKQTAAAYRRADRWLRELLSKPGKWVDVSACGRKIHQRYVVRYVYHDRGGAGKGKHLRSAPEVVTWTSNGWSHAYGCGSGSIGHKSMEQWVSDD